MVEETLIQQVYFNSHPHEEDDDLEKVSRLLLEYFNSHPHEEDDGHTVESMQRS